MLFLKFRVTVMEKCNLCPRKCNVDRSLQKGFCGTNLEILIARAAPHYWEEPCISGQKGSGAIFFGGCNLRCCYCQNAKISRGAGKPHTVGQLADVFENLQKQGVHNINLVTPTHYTNQIVSALDIFTPDIPVVWNSGGYDSVEAIKLLEGRVNIFLPDFKYANADIAKKYSAAEDYPAVAINAIKQMLKQTGKAKLDSDGIMQKGIIIRHLVLPDNTKHSIKALKLLFDNFGNDVYYSIMAQYTPMHNTPYKELCRTLTQQEYDEVLNAVEQLGIEYGYTQELEAIGESFIPDFEI